MSLADLIRGKNGTGEVASAKVARVAKDGERTDSSNFSNSSASNPPGLKIEPPLFDAPDTVAPVATVAVAAQPEPLPELSPEAASNIRAWLAHIEETDPAIIAGVVDKCRNDLEARRYFLKRSGEVPEPTRVSRSVHCGDCIHFERIDHPHLGHCAKGEPEAIAGLWDTDQRYCERFVPQP